jgi:ribosomal protein S10
MNMPNPEKLAESTTLQVLSRLSMLATPVLITGIIFFGKAWIEHKFEAQSAVSQTQAEGMRTMRQDVDGLRNEIPQAKERIRVIESTMERGRTDREQFQNQTRETLTKLLDINTAIVRELSALRSTVEAQQRQIDRGVR